MGQSKAFRDPALSSVPVMDSGEEIDLYNVNNLYKQLLLCIVHIYAANLFQCLLNQRKAGVA